MKQKHVLVFLLVILVLSIITGIVYGVNNDYNVDLYLETLNNHENLYLKHILIIFLFFFSTLSLIGIIFETIIVSVEGISLGYVITIFYLKYKFKGLLFVLIHFILNKLILYLLLGYLFYVSYNYIKKVFLNLVGVNKDFVNSLVIPLIKKYFIISVISLMNSTFIYFCANFILKFFSSML